jgi:arylsulfatase
VARQINLGVVPAGTKLTARPKEIPAWDSLTADQKKLYAHMMEVYAGCLAFCDSNIGRVIKAVEDTGELDNTLIIFIMGDNGAKDPKGTAPSQTSARYLRNYLPLENPRHT